MPQIVFFGFSLWIEVRELGLLQSAVQDGEAVWRNQFISRQINNGNKDGLCIYLVGRGQPMILDDFMNDLGQKQDLIQEIARAIIDLSLIALSSRKNGKPPLYLILQQSHLFLPSPFLCTPFSINYIDYQVKDDFPLRASYLHYFGAISLLFDNLTHQGGNIDLHDCFLKSSDKLTLFHQNFFHIILISQLPQEGERKEAFLQIELER